MQKLLNEMMIRVTTHDSKLNDKAHGHHTVQTLNSNLMFIDIGFTTEIPRLSEYEAIENDTKTIQCYTDGSKMNDKVGAGVYIVDNDTPTCEESYHLGTNSTVFQAETFAVGTAAKILLDSGTKNRKIIINCDSQATIMAMSNIKVKSKSTSTAISELNQLAMDNQVLPVKNIILQPDLAASSYDLAARSMIWQQDHTTSKYLPTRAPWIC